MSAATSAASRGQEQTEAAASLHGELISSKLDDDELRNKNTQHTPGAGFQITP
jgi:hypothetical protein